MHIFRQIAAVTALNFKSLPSRIWPSLVIVVGLACVICVLTAMLSMTTGYAAAEMKAGDPGRAIVLAAGAENEGGSNIPRASVGPIADSPGIAKDADGTPIADAEITTTIRASRKANGLIGPFIMRGIGRKGLALRPELKLVSGRMIRPGAREILVGIAAQKLLNHFDVGDKILMPDGEWPIVGIFTTGGDTLEGELIADADTMMGALRRKGYSSVIVRLEKPDALNTLGRALAANPALAVRVERHSDYYARLSQQTAGFFKDVAYFIAAIMAFGALFGTLNTLYSAVSARTQEIGTLRALGFGGLPVAVSVLLESLLLALSGALLGAGIAWAVFDGNQYNFGNNIFDLTVSPTLIGLGMGWALIVALIGGLLPSIRAARLPIVEALRST